MTKKKPRIKRHWNTKTGKFYWTFCAIQPTGWANSISHESVSLNRYAGVWCLQQNEKENSLSQ